MKVTRSIKSVRVGVGVGKSNKQRVNIIIQKAEGYLIETSVCALGFYQAEVSLGDRFQKPMQCNDESEGRKEV